APLADPRRARAKAYRSKRICATELSGKLSRARIGSVRFDRTHGLREQNSRPSLFVLGNDASGLEQPRLVGQVAQRIWDRTRRSGRFSYPVKHLESHYPRKQSINKNRSGKADYMKKQFINQTTGAAARLPRRSSLFLSAALVMLASRASPAMAGDHSRGREHRFQPQHYCQANLVSDQPEVAMLQDTNLVNTWGITFS